MGALALPRPISPSAIAGFLIMMVMIIVIVMIRFHACKACCAGGAAPLVFRKLRERTKRPLERNALRWIVIHVFRGNDLVRRPSVFDPLIEGRENVV